MPKCDRCGKIVNDVRKHKARGRCNARGKGEKTKGVGPPTVGQSGYQYERPLTY